MTLEEMIRIYQQGQGGMTQGRMPMGQPPQRPSMIPAPEMQSPGYDPSRTAPGATMEDIRGPQQMGPQMSPGMLEMLKSKMMSGGATDIRNMGMGMGMGRMSMGGQAADPIRQMASQLGGNGLKQLLAMLQQRGNIEGRGPGGGPLSRSGMPMRQAYGAAFGGEQQ